MAKCPGQKTLEVYAIEPEKLLYTVSNEMEGHTARCEECRRFVEMLRAYASFMTNSS